jgi:hypothetical protein
MPRTVSVIDSMARTLALADKAPDPFPWERMPEFEKARYRVMAAGALSVLLPARCLNCSSS